MKGNTKIYNELSKTYNDLYLKNIRSFQENCEGKTQVDENYVDFYPSFGFPKDGKKGEFLIYGQATNGWASGFKTRDLIDDKDKLAQSIGESNEISSEQDHNPLDWVNVFWSKSTYKEHTQNDVARDFYNRNNLQNPDFLTHRSFFWNVTYKLINGPDKNSWDWSKQMVWSNLWASLKTGFNFFDSFFGSSVFIKL